MGKTVYFGPRTGKDRSRMKTTTASLQAAPVINKRRKWLKAAAEPDGISMNDAPRTISRLYHADLIRQGAPGRYVITAAGRRKLEEDQ